MWDFVPPEVCGASKGGHGAVMCNLYRMEKAPDAIIQFTRALGRVIDFPEGVPNFQPRDDQVERRRRETAASNSSSGAGAGRRRPASRYSTFAAKAAGSIPPNDA